MESKFMNKGHYFVDHHVHFERVEEEAAQSPWNIQKNFGAKVHLQA